MFKKRVIAATVATFTVGVIFGLNMYEFDTYCFRALFGAFLAFSVASIVVALRSDRAKNSKLVIAVAIMVAAFSFGVLRVSIFNHNIRYTQTFSGKAGWATFEIKDVGSVYIDADVISCETGLSSGETVRLFPNEIPEGLIAGDEIDGYVRYKAQVSSSYFAENIALTAMCNINETREGSDAFCVIRRYVATKSDELFFKKHNSYSPAITKAVTVGDRSGLDSYIFTVYKTAGISHILAISGLHISLIIMTFYSVLQTIGVNKKFNCIASSIIALLYAALVGFTPGAVRSAIMMIILMISRLYLKRSDVVTSLFVALAILLIINPYAICSVGLQLSFLCSLGILLSEPILYKINCYFMEKSIRAPKLKKRLYKLIPTMISPLIVSFASTVFSFPVICISFDSLSYISPLTNIISVPLYSYAIGIAFVCLLIAPISWVMADIVAYPASFIFDAVTDFAAWLNKVDIGIISTHTWAVSIPFIISILMIMSLIFLRRRKIRISFCLSVLFCISIAVCGLTNKLYYTGKTIVEYGDYNKEYVYFQLENENRYIDYGGYTSFPDVVLENGETSLEKYVVVGYDDYTLKRFEYLSGKINVNAVSLPIPKNEYEYSVYSSIKELANERNCDIINTNSSYSEVVNNNNNIYILEENDLFDGSVLYIHCEEKTICILIDGYSMPVECDVAIICNNYYGDIFNISAESVYYRIDYTENANIKLIGNAFEQRIKLVLNNREGTLEIYEP